MNQSIRKRRRDRHKLRKSREKFALQFNFGGFNIEAKFSAFSGSLLPSAERLTVIAKRLSRQLADALNQGNFPIRSLNPCVFNSGSQYLKCAVNPKVDCNTCKHYEPISSSIKF